MILRLTSLIFSVFTIMLFSCCRAPIIQLDSGLVSGVVDFKDMSLKRIRGFGDLAVSIDGRRYNGSIDIDWKGDSFKADMYSPFGTLITTIHSDSSLAVVSSGDDEFRFLVDTIPEMFPFVLVDDLDFKDLVFILTGRLPDGYNRLNSKPDTIIQERRGSALVWRTDSVETVAYIPKKNTMITKVEVRNSKNRGWSLIFNGINRMLARSVELRVDDRNYFSVHYEQLKME